MTDVVVRLARPEDASAIRAIYAPLVAETAISFELEPPTVAEMRGRIQRTLLAHPWVVCAEGAEVVGYAYAGQHRTRAAYQWSADVSAYLRADRRGRGIGRALYTALFALLRVQGFRNVEAGIALPNPASVALHEAMGMRPVGVYREVGYKLGRWHDVGWWQGALREHVQDPPPPLDLAAAMACAGWGDALAAGTALLRGSA